MLLLSIVSIMKKNISFFSNQKFFGSRKLFLLMILIIVIGIIVLIYLLISQSYNYKSISNNSSATSVCTSKRAGNLLQQAQIPLFGTEQPQLLSIVNNIKKLPGYQRDPNCLYVIATYYINASTTHINNLTKAKFYLTKLNQYYNPKIQLSPLLGPDIPGVLGLNQQLSQLEVKP